MTQSSCQSLERVEKQRLCEDRGRGRSPGLPPASIIKEMVEVVRSQKEWAYFGLVEFGVWGASQQGYSLGQWA